MPSSRSCRQHRGNREQRRRTPLDTVLHPRRCGRSGHGLRCGCHILPLASPGSRSGLLLLLKKDEPISNGNPDCPHIFSYGPKGLENRICWARRQLLERKGLRLGEPRWYAVPTRSCQWLPTLPAVTCLNSVVRPQTKADAGGVVGEGRRFTRFLSTGAPGREPFHLTVQWRESFSSSRLGLLGLRLQ